jgi:hypothetical protein
MTRRQPKAPAVIDANMAGVEKLFAERGATDLAKLIADRLREPAPKPEILDTVARLLDPRPGDELRMVIERTRKGNPKVTRLAKRADDIRIALAVLKAEQKAGAGKPQRGYRKGAIARVAHQLGISESKARQALSQILRRIPK